MRQLIVECSDPGLVISLAEEFENVMRQIDFARARALHGQLSRLAQELGPEFEAAWQGFRLEVPNDGGSPPTFGKRDFAGEETLQQFLDQATEQSLGRFELRETMLLPQGGPAPETREQYVRDLADNIRWSSWEELGVFRSPVPLPATMADHRQRLMDEHVAPTLRARANYPTLGHRWVRDSVKQLEKALQEVNTRSESVISYELTRLEPAEVELREQVRWAVLSVRLGKEVEKWCRPAEESLAYIYQRAALIWLLWTECHGWGPARSYLEGRLGALIEEAETTYTADGVDALQLLDEEMHRRPWDNLGGLLNEAEEKDQDEDTTVED